MLEFDDSKLRARVIRDYQSLAHDITDAGDMNRFVGAIMDTAVGALRELLNAVNQAGVIARLPSDVLAACFARLPFRYRTPVTHVCRSWRAAALAEPSLWCRIQPWTPLKSPELVRMALSRAGALPIDMMLDSRAPAAPDAIRAAIAPFSHLIRHLAWHSDKPITSLEFPAPLMECFWSSSLTTITERFLGGHAGRLRYLYLQYVQLPAACPALSTVTVLSVGLTPFKDGAAPSMLGNLFSLFPRLEFLNIHGITRGDAHLLPIGRAPASLTELRLHTKSVDYDLIPLYLAYDSGNVHRVDLRQCSGTRPNLEPLASGAVRLAVTHTSETSTSLQFEHSATVHYSLGLLTIGLSNTAVLLAAAQSSFNDVHTAMVSHTALEPLVGVLAALPQLEHLFVHIVPRDDQSYPPPRPHVFVWAPLACLSHFAGIAPPLGAITLHVWCGDVCKPSYATAEQARELLAQLRALPGGLPPIEIQGFRAKQLASVDVAGLNVRFNVAARVGDLVLRKSRDPFNSFSNPWSDW